MADISPVPAVVAVFTSLATAKLILRFSAAPAQQGRFVTVDGLRGFLAFFVFLHHAAIWFFYTKTGEWAPPPSNLYENFGASSVALFFMITAFLFYSKLLHARAKGMDWARLFISRIMRLVPLYFFVMLLMLIVVGFLSEWQLSDPAIKLIKGSVKWLGFSIFGEPDLNGIVGTRFIIADVNWSLPYEWLFYLSLPVIAIALKIKASIRYYLLSCAGIGAAFIWMPHSIHLASFGGGIIAASLYNNSKFQTLASSSLSSAVALACYFTAVLSFESTNAALPLILLSIAFILVAGGANLFGLLTLPVSRILGEMAYSIYLLHGIILFVVFKFLIGTDQAKALTEWQHWLIIFGLTPLLIGICFTTFKLIEKPAMDAVPGLMNRLRG